MPSAAVTLCAPSAVAPLSRAAPTGARRGSVATGARMIRCSSDVTKHMAGGILGAAAASLMFVGGPAAAEVRLPPIDSDPGRCERAFVGNTIGQANAVSDRVLDLRQCKFDGSDLSQKTLSGAFMSDASFKNSNMQEVVLSKAYARNSDFSGADMTNGVLDRVDFTGSNMAGVNFTNAVLTGVFWENSNLEGAVFEDALIGSQDARNLCANPTLTGDSRIGVGCR